MLSWFSGCSPASCSGGAKLKKLYEEDACEQRLEMMLTTMLGPTCRAPARPMPALAAALATGEAPIRKRRCSVALATTTTKKQEPATATKKGTAAVRKAPVAKCVVWVAVDPRKGTITAFPGDCASRIEDHYRQGQTSVSLRGFGGAYDQTTIELLKTKSGRPEHVLATGRRGGVRRVELARGSRSLKLHVVNEGGWRFCEEAIPSRSVERTLELLGFEAVDISSESGNQSPRLDFCRAERKEVLQKNDEDGLVGIWEWCKLARVSDLTEVTEEQWGFYDEASTRCIEEAFRTEKLSAMVSVGIRTYEIIFDMPGKARQVDHTLRKSRHVRRRAVTQEERDAIFGSTVPSGVPEGLMQEECAICCSTFAETPFVEAVCLSECGHCFHRPCIQHSADRRACCPLCRAEIDWERVVAQPEES